MGARTPRELVRVLEVESILTNAELVLHACLARRASSVQLQFTHLDYPEQDPPEWHRFVTVRQTPQGVEEGSLPIDYHGNLPEEYERHAAASPLRSEG
jgi:succinate dehydrogenase/fumarate reductase flavoprotein subunit